MSSATVPITQDVSDIQAPAPTVDSNSAAQTITSAVQAPSPDQQYQQAPAATTPTIDNSVSPQPLWRSILGGALVGLAHGGVMGALANAVQPRRFEQVQADAEQKRQLQNQQLDQQLQEGSVKMAHTTAETAVLNTQYSMMPKSIQEAADQESFRIGQDLEMKQGITPTMTGLTHDGATEFLQHVFNTTPTGQQYQAYSDGKGRFNIYKVDDPNALNRTNVTVTIGAHPGKNADGSLDWENPVRETQEIPAGSMKMADILHAPVAAMASYWKDYNSNATKKDQATAGIANAVTKEKALIPVKAATAAAETQAKLAVTPKRGDDDNVIAATPDGSNTVMTRKEAEDGGLFHYKADPLED